MAGRHSAERGEISSHNKSTGSPVCSAGTRKLQRLPVPPPDCQAARLPTARLPFCGGKKARSGLLWKGANKSTIRRVSSSHPHLYAPRGECADRCRLPAAWRCAPLGLFHRECVMIPAVRRQHGQTAASALKLRRALARTLLSFSFCAILDSSKAQPLG